MADGRTHARGTAIAGTVLVAASLASAALVHPACIGLAAGALVGHLVTPDLDLAEQITYCERRIYRWNRLAGWCWVQFWRPYARRNNHRGRSHSWPRGTWDRFSYLLWLPVAVTLLWFGWPAVAFWLCVFAGQSVQDWVHLWLDGMLFKRR